MANRVGPIWLEQACVVVGLLSGRRFVALLVKGFCLKVQLGPRY